MDFIGSQFWCINFGVLMRVIDAVKENIADVSSVSPSSFALKPNLTHLPPPQHSLHPLLLSQPSCACLRG